ncbi:TetR/AcrR family transcriptional regulator [Allokutzneria albata]|uniref:DNA-binding transcriptional regulator, AcrR family n=1 Tax=Allokutzneria albata TaxID=211114 RepID=A0A1G9SXN0_ALLAB|nr:TetR family transcriptional regulator [Allokutzneria albata]SDM40191.1 DNA-binding transcriptional regulator, AcrR family [Allokutzneria albata]
MPSNDQEMGLRARKKLETHRALAKAALRLAAERGLDNVTAEDISAAAGVSPRTFFNYFASKEDAILVAYPESEQGAENLIRRFLDAPAELSPLEALMEMMAEDMGVLDDNREEWLSRFAIVDENPALTARIVSGQLSGEQKMIDAIAERTGLDSTEDLYPALLFATFGAAVKAATKLWARNGGRQPVAELIRAAVDSLAAGLPVPATRPSRGNS